MKKIYGLLLGGALTLSLGGVIGSSLSKTDVSEAKAVNVSTVDELKSALASATSETEIIVQNRITLNPDDFSSSSYILDGKGATIRVPVPYVNENVEFNKDTWSGFGVFHVDGGNHSLTIKNMTVMGGRSRGDKGRAYQWSGAINVNTGQVVEIDNVNFTQSNTGLSLTNNNGNAKVIVKNSSFYKNVAQNGGAIVVGGGTLVADNCSFVSNGATCWSGGAISLEDNYNQDKYSTAYINNCVFANNNCTFDRGGAIYKDRKSKLYLMNSTICGNSTFHASYSVDDVDYYGTININDYTDTTSSFFGVNNVITDNYIMWAVGQKSQRSDFIQQDDNVPLYMYNSVNGVMILEQGSGNVIEGCKECIDNTFASGYENILNYVNEYEYTGSQGYPNTVKFKHPMTVQKGTNPYSFYVPASRKGPAATGGAKTYFDYSAFPTVKMGFGESSSITALGTLEAPTSDKKVTKYFEGTTRVDGVIGACALAPKDYYFIEKGNVTNGTMTGIPDEGANNIEGTSYTLEATPNDGYGFRYWSISNSEDKPTDNPYTFTPTGSATVAPVFRKIVNVAYNLNGGTGTTPDTEECITGNSITTAASTGFSRPGYTFVCWNTKADGKGTNVNAESSYTVNAATTLYAKWTANQYEVTLDHNNGSGASTVVNATFDANMPTVTAPTKEGFVFDGYYDALEGGTKYYNIDGTSAKKWDKPSTATLYAHWVFPIEYEAVSFDGDYDGQPHTISVSVTTQGEFTIKYGTSASDITLDEAPTYTDVKKNEAAYEVFFKIEAEGYGSVVDSATVTLHKVAAQNVTPTAKENLYYKGENLELLEECTSTEGTVQYSSTETGTYSANIPTGLEIGEYEIFYKVVGDGNHTDSEVKSMKVSILENDKTTLNKAIENGDKLHNLIKDKYPEIDAVLATALTEGKEVKDNTTALPKDITDATTKINEACVNAIQKLVESIGEIKNDEQSKESVELARAAYESLSEEQKLLIPQKTLADLEAKEAEYKKVSSGLAWWAIALIVVACLAVVCAVAYVLMFYVFHKWIKQNKEAVKVFKCGHKHGKARLFTKSLKVMYRFDEEVFKTKEEALK